MTALARYAIYYSPRAHPRLLQLANAWLGRDAATGQSLPAPKLPGLSQSEIETLTRTPRRYGFHATLKAPFRLRRGMQEDALIAELKNFASGHEPFECPPLKVAILGRFVCLRPATGCPELDELAMACVRQFESFRAPLSSKEYAKRNVTALTESQRHNLSAYGYPYVGADFRFHLTLTNPLPSAKQTVLTRLLADYFRSALGELLRLEGISLYRQPDRQTPFEIVECFPFGGTALGS